MPDLLSPSVKGILGLPEGYPDIGDPAVDPYASLGLGASVKATPIPEATGRAMAQGLTNAASHIAHIPERAMMASADRLLGGELDVAPMGETALMLLGLNTPFAARGAVGAAGGKLAQPEGIRAYHGSPHDFAPVPENPLGRFDLSRIGTGEGAQSYGHGLYFAENPAVAEEIKKRLSGSDAWKKVDRYELFDAPSGMMAARASDGGLLGTYHQIGDNAYLATADSGGRVGLNRQVATEAEAKAAIEEYAKGNRGSGRMYDVNINANREHFLDWDKPLSGQPPNMQAFFKKAAPELDPQMAAGQAYRQLARPKEFTLDVNGRPLNGEAELSNALRDAGIPGIRYLDQGSRNKGTGTSNYVVFDDKIINILRKYGLLGGMSVEAAREMLNGQANEQVQ